MGLVNDPIEAVLLTGGASRRMGTDKASLLVHGVPMAERIARELAKACDPVTVIGRSSLPGYLFLEDKDEFAGPLAALAAFTPTRPLVFIASCDLPRFNAQLIEELEEALDDADAAIPSVEGRLQPLCALYRAEALTRARALAEQGEKRVMRWVDTLRVKTVEPKNEEALRSANTPEELRALLESP